VAVFNLAPHDARAAFRWADAGVSAPPSRMRDLWQHAGRQPSGPEYSAEVPGHGVVLVRIN